MLLEPFLPETAEKILKALGQENFTTQNFDTLKVWGLLEPENKINKNEALFPRIQ